MISSSKTQKNEQQKSREKPYLVGAGEGVAGGEGAVAGEGARDEEGAAGGSGGSSLEVKWVGFLDPTWYTLHPPLAGGEVARFRNDVVHEAGLIRKSVLFDSIREFSFCWVRNRQKRLLVNWTSWLQFPLNFL
ncbi:hypothetical protein LXL04_037880 [Taraxacum kok-saghyz]